MRLLLGIAEAGFFPGIILDFRKSRGIGEESQPIDGAGVYWRKEA